METKEDKGIRFTGGDNLTGILKVYNEILMKNELEDGYGAYQLSCAGPTSGLSFGGNQMDMSVCGDARELFLDIIENAVDDNNMRFFSDQECNEMKDYVIPRIIRIKGDSPQGIFLNHQLPRINKALSSKYGIEKINEEYVKQITIDSIHIDNIVHSIVSPFAKAYYSSPLGKLFLLDYNNQFYLNPHGELKRYLDGYKTITYTQKAMIVSVTTAYTLANHRAFLHNTKEGAEDPEEVDRRLNNILCVYTPYASGAAQLK